MCEKWLVIDESRKVFSQFATIEGNLKVLTDHGKEFRLILWSLKTFKQFFNNRKAVL